MHMFVDSALQSESTMIATRTSLNISADIMLSKYSSTVVAGWPKRPQWLRTPLEDYGAGGALMCLRISEEALPH